VPEARISVVPCGVDPAVFVPGSAREGAGEEPLHFLFVGDLVPAKGVAELVDAALRVLDHGVVARFTLVGDGPLRETLAAQVEARGHGEAIRLTGPLPRAEVAERVKQAGCLVLASHTEGTPVCIMEALTVGIPVIASRVGGIPDQVSEGENGLLIPPEDVPALADAMTRLVTDNELRSRLRKGAGATGDRFSLARRRGEVRQALDRWMPAAGQEN
jgi:glycosyltransferase involved in cell wall biosynthesis